LRNRFPTRPGHDNHRGQLQRIRSGYGQGVAKQVHAIRDNCKDCLVVLAPSANDSAALAALNDTDPSAMNETDIIGQGFSPTIMISALSEQSRLRSTTSRKPSARYMESPDMALSCGSARQQHSQHVHVGFQRNLLLLQRRHHASSGPSQHGRNRHRTLPILFRLRPLPCPKTGPSICNSTFLSADGNQSQPAFSQWFGGCQTYHTTDSQTPIIFSQDGKGSCDFGRISTSSAASPVSSSETPAKGHQPTFSKTLKGTTRAMRARPKLPPTRQRRFSALFEDGRDIRRVRRISGHVHLRCAVRFRPLLLLAISEQESSGNPYAVSYTGRLAAEDWGALERAWIKTPRLTGRKEIFRKGCQQGRNPGP